MRRFLFVLAVVALATVGCENPVEVQSDILQVRKAASDVELTNVSNAPVYYFAVDRALLALLDWVPCADPATCQGIPAGAAKQVPFDSIEGYSATTADVVVYHWRLVRNVGTSGFRPDSVRAVIVPIR